MVTVKRSAQMPTKRARIPRVPICPFIILLNDKIEGHFIEPRLLRVFASSCPPSSVFELQCVKVFSEYSTRGFLIGHPRPLFHLFSVLINISTFYNTKVDVTEKMIYLTSGAGIQSHDQCDQIKIAKCL